MQRLLLFFALFSCGGPAIAQELAVAKPQMPGAPAPNAPTNLAGDLVARNFSSDRSIHMLALPIHIAKSRQGGRDGTCYTIRSHNFDESDVPRKTGETTCVRADRNLLKKVPAR